MKSFFFRLLPFICSLLISTVLFASEQTVQSVGMGNTYDEARTNAIRYALENVFGTFISSQTEIRNDILQKDETYGISFGHIKKIKEINSSKINGAFSVTLQVTISTEKLVSFVRSKGMVVEYNGDDFATNIKVQLLNEKNDAHSVDILMQYAQLVLPNCFDYEIKAGNPRNYMKGAWEINLTLNIKANDNLKTLVTHLQKTLADLSLTSADIETRNAFGKYPYSLSFNNTLYKFRSNQSRINFWNTFRTETGSIRESAMCAIFEKVKVDMDAGQYSEDLKFSKECWAGFCLKDIAIYTSRNPSFNDDLSDVCYINIPLNRQDNQMATYAYTLLWKGGDEYALKAIQNIRGFKVIK
ncbi:MAG: hypothetical protein FGM61_03340 [Sediminibacterium sp.]|nr:hypothetical protein [Sediminibacterium sp.]